MNGMLLEIRMLKVLLVRFLKEMLLGRGRKVVPVITWLNNYSTLKWKIGLVSIEFLDS